MVPQELLIRLQNDKKRTYDLKATERETILKALNELGRSRYTKEQIAEELGIGIATLYRKLREYDIREESRYFSR